MHYNTQRGNTLQQYGGARKSGENGFGSNHDFQSKYDSPYKDRTTRRAPLSNITNQVTNKNNHNFNGNNLNIGKHGVLSVPDLTSHEFVRVSPDLSGTFDDRNRFSHRDVYQNNVDAHLDNIQTLHLSDDEHTNMLKTSNNNGINGFAQHPHTVRIPIDNGNENICFENNILSANSLSSLKQENHFLSRQNRELLQSIDKLKSEHEMKIRDIESKHTAQILKTKQEFTEQISKQNHVIESRIESSKRVVHLERELNEKNEIINNNKEFISKQADEICLLQTTNSKLKSEVITLREENTRLVSEKNTWDALYDKQQLYNNNVFGNNDQISIDYMVRRHEKEMSMLKQKWRSQAHSKIKEMERHFKERLSEVQRRMETRPNGDTFEMVESLKNQIKSYRDALNAERDISSNQYASLKFDLEKEISQRYNGKLKETLERYKSKYKAHLKAKIAEKEREILKMLESGYNKRLKQTCRKYEHQIHELQVRLADLKGNRKNMSFKDHLSDLSSLDDEDSLFRSDGENPHYMKYHSMSEHKTRKGGKMF